jgi:CheY-like chemotaxis protein
MRVLVVAASTEASAVAEGLRSGGHDVWMVEDEAQARAVRAERPLDLAIVATSEVSERPLAVIRTLLASGRRPYVLLLHPSLPDDFIVRALEAGADADLKSPLTPQYLAARLGAVERRSALPPTTEGPLMASLPPADGRARLDSRLPGAARGSPSLIPGAGPLSSAAGSGTWSTAAEQMADAASRFLALPVGWDSLPASGAAPSVAVGIVLLDAQQHLELRIALGADPSSARALAVHLFGADGEDLGPDVMNELANILMGTLKTSFAGEGLTFTSGLPAEIPAEEVLRPSAPYQAQEALLFTLAEARLVVHIALRARANQLVITLRLEEGMVLAKHVFHPRGMLLVDAGTRLSQHTVERMRASLPGTYRIEVSTA